MTEKNHPQNDDVVAFVAESERLVTIGKNPKELRESERDDPDAVIAISDPMISSRSNWRNDVAGVEKHGSHSDLPVRYLA